MARKAILPTIGHVANMPWTAIKATCGAAELWVRDLGTLAHKMSDTKKIG